MTTLIFDTKNKKEYISENYSGILAPSLEHFKCYIQNETLINIISNVPKINEIIDLIIADIKEKHVTNNIHIYNLEDNLEKTSYLFNLLWLHAHKYAENKENNIKEIVNKLSKKNDGYEKDIEVLKKSLKTKTLVVETELTNDFDFGKINFIIEIENTYKYQFPKEILDIYLEEKDYDNLSLEKRKIVDKHMEKAYEYILKTYKKDYRDYFKKHVVDYQESIDKKEKYIKENVTKINKNKKQLKNIFIDSLIDYLDKLKGTIQYVEYRIKALNCIGYEDDTFKWQEISREERLCLASIYANPFNVDFELPKSKIIYAIEEKNKITPLENYATSSIVSNKGKPFINIMNDFLNKNLIELHQYSCNDIVETINVLFYEYKISNIQINKCKNCRKYFIPQNRSDEVYCDRISPQNPNKTCKQYGVKKTYRERQKEEPVTNEHTRTSQFFRMRYKRAEEKNKTPYKNQLDNYLKEYKLKLEKYRSGKLNEQDFIKWIKNKKEGVKNGNNRNNKK